MDVTLKFTVNTDSKWAGDLTERIAVAVERFKDSIICGSRSPLGERCELEINHDGPRCQNGVISWPSPHAGYAPDNRHFVRGAKVRRRSDEKLFVMEEISLDAGTVFLTSEDGNDFAEGPRNGTFWAEFYAVGDVPAAPKLEVQS